MYTVLIQTTNGPVVTEINELSELDEALAPYYETYISCVTHYQEGEAKSLPKKKNKKYNTQTKITDFDIDWKKIKSACMTTISKEAGDKEPSHEWKRKLLLAEHSPVRRGTISWKWEQIPYAISTHFVRHHEGVEKWVGTSRPDRTDIKDRSKRTQMDYVPMEMEANIQALINISRKRLCNCADPTTRLYWKAVLEAIKEYDEDIYWACVPECIRCGGCPEYKTCGYYDIFSKNLTPEEQIDIHKRYDKYNEERVKTLSLKK